MPKIAVKSIMFSVEKKTRVKIVLSIGACVAAFFPSFARADGSVISLGSKFELNGKAISPQCLLPLFPLASGDLMATEVPLQLPNFRGCIDGNFSPTVHDAAGNVSTKMIDGRQLGYKIISHRGGQFLLRMSSTEEGSLVQRMDLWVASRSRPIRHTLPNGRVTLSLFPTITLEAAQIVRTPEEKSVLLEAFETSNKAPR